MSSVFSFREVIPYLTYENKLAEKIVSEALLAVMDDLDLAGYIPRPETKEKIAMLELLIEDRRLSDLVDEDEEEKIEIDPSIDLDEIEDEEDEEDEEEDEDEEDWDFDEDDDYSDDEDED